MDKSLSSGYRNWFPPTLNRWIAIYPVDSAIQRLNNRGLMVKNKQWLMCFKLFETFYLKGIND